MSNYLIVRAEFGKSAKVSRHYAISTEPFANADSFQVGDNLAIQINQCRNISVIIEAIMDTSGGLTVLHKDPRMLPEYEVITGFITPAFVEEHSIYMNQEV